MTRCTDTFSDAMHRSVILSITMLCPGKATGLSLSGLNGSGYLMRATISFMISVMNGCAFTAAF